MEDIRKALAISIIARGSSALLGLFVLPFYIRFLGIEAYGVVGIFATLQVLVAFMDLGLATSLTRALSEVAGNREKLGYTRSVALSFEMAYLSLSFLMGLTLFTLAPIVSSHWVNLETLAERDVSSALQLASLALACQWPSNLYGAGLAGIHRQVDFAVSSTLFALVRVAMSLIALWYLPTLDSFFIAQIASAVLQSTGTRLQLWHSIRLKGHSAEVSFSLLRQSKDFAAGMTFITVTSIVLLQIDKVILSYILPLVDFGIYIVANSLATGLYILIGPVFSVIYPRLSSMISAGDNKGIIDLYHASSQIMAVLVVPLAAVMISFPTQVLFVLTNDAVLSQRGAPILTFLVCGYVINGLMNIPYALQLASGWTSLSVWINLAAITVLVPLVWVGALHFGGTGGAAAWALLNISYLLVTPRIMHRRLLRDQMWAWYFKDVIPPLIICTISMLILKEFAGFANNRWFDAIQLALFWSIAIVPTAIATRSVRGLLARLIWR